MKKLTTVFAPLSPISPRPALSWVFGSLLALMPMTAQAVPLTFDTIVGQSDGTNLLGATVNTRTIYFLDVGTENGTTVDAKVTATLIGDTHFADQNDPDAVNQFGDAGFIPDYSNSRNGPQSDLGFLYYGTGVDTNEDGLDLTFEFFEGTGDQSGLYITPMVLPRLEIAIYDVDGESSQSEYFTAWKSDGLVSYATGTSAQALVATEKTDGILFEGPGQNFSESDATGAAILYYELSNSLTISFGSVQNSGPSQNGVFSAIDGDLSLFADTEFGELVNVTQVPLPASAFMFFVSIAGLLSLTRRRRNSCWL